MSQSCCCCLKKNLNAPRPSELVISHIQRIGCQPEKTTLHGGQSRSWSAEQGKENKRKSLAAYPPLTPHTARSEKINKITRPIYRRYAGLGRSRVRTRIPSARRLGLWVWLHNGLADNQQTGSTCSLEGQTGTRVPSTLIHAPPHHGGHWPMLVRDPPKACGVVGV